MPVSRCECRRFRPGKVHGSEGKLMEWCEEGVVLARRRHGENALIIEVFTRGHGRHAGIVRGGGSRRLAPVLEPGNQVQVTWRARLAEHLGSFEVEPVLARAALLMGERRTLAGLNAVTALLSYALPEREPHPALYDGTLTVLEMMCDGPFWPLAYVRWELALLEELGFGLDLSRCAVTGATEGLAFVSPKSGRAVSDAGAGEWKPNLLPLSPSLLGQGSGTAAEISDGLKTTCHFLKSRLVPALGNRRLPEARDRLAGILAGES